MTAVWFACVVMQGYCKVFRKLNWADEATDVDQASRSKRLCITALSLSMWPWCRKKLMP